LNLRALSTAGLLECKANKQKAILELIAVSVRKSPPLSPPVRQVKRIVTIYCMLDRLCGLVVRVPGYRSGGPGSIPSTARKKSSGFGRGPLSLVSTTEELLDRKVAASV
jgi:hypothetical protein